MKMTSIQPANRQLIISLLMMLFVVQASLIQEQLIPSQPSWLLSSYQSIHQSHGHNLVQKHTDTHRSLEHIEKLSDGISFNLQHIAFSPVFDIPAQSRTRSPNKNTSNHYLNPDLYPENPPPKAFM